MPVCGMSLYSSITNTELAVGTLLSSLIFNQNYKISPLWQSLMLRMLIYGSDQKRGWKNLGLLENVFRFFKKKLDFSVYKIPTQENHPLHYSLCPSFSIYYIKSQKSRLKYEI